MHLIGNNIRGLARAPLVIFLVALCLHIACVFARGAYKRPALFENGAIAQCLLDGKGFAMATYHPPAPRDDHSESDRPDKPFWPVLMTPRPTSNQAPGYPWLLYCAWRVMGKSATTYLCLSLLQAILVSTIVFPLMGLTRRWFGPAAAVPAGWLACLAPLYAWAATAIVQAAICFTLHAWLLWGWLSLVSRRRALWQVAGVGVGTGVAGLFQPVTLAFFGLLGLILLAKSLRQRTGIIAAQLVLCAVLVIAVLAPWTIRNYRVQGRLVLIKNCFGKELWIGNNPVATGTPVLPFGGADIFEAQTRDRIRMEHQSQLSETALMEAFSAEALAYIRANPGAFALRTLKKIVWFWTMVPKQYLVRGGNVSSEWLFNRAAAWYWMGLLALACYARFARIRFPAEYSQVLLTGFVVYSLVYGLTFVGHVRFRGEVEYVVISAAAQGLLGLTNMVRGRATTVRAGGDTSEA